MLMNLKKPSETIKTEVKKSTPVTTSPVATGDDTKQEFWYALLGLSISTLLLLLIKHYKNKTRVVAFCFCLWYDSVGDENVSVNDRFNKI